MEVMSVMRLLLVVAVCCVLLASPTSARPPHRQKRVSDQRLAELETLLALAKMNNRKYVTLPVGFGLIDVKQIGRRKRAVEVRRGDYDMSELLAELAATHTLREPSALQDTYPGQDLILTQDLLEEHQDPRLRGDQIQARERPDSPPFLYGLGGFPHPRFI